jgi:hypothetical protein
VTVAVITTSILKSGRKIKRRIFNMSERFVRIGVEIPLSLYANLDKIKNGSAASDRILEAIKREKTEMKKAREEFTHWKTTKTYKNSVYGEMKKEDDNG